MNKRLFGLITLFFLFSVNLIAANPTPKLFDKKTSPKQKAKIIWTLVHKLIEKKMAPKGMKELVLEVGTPKYAKLPVAQLVKVVTSNGDEVGPKVRREAVLALIELKSYSILRPGAELLPILAQYKSYLNDQAPFDKETKEYVNLLGELLGKSPEEVDSERRRTPRNRTTTTH